MNELAGSAATLPPSFHVPSVFRSVAAKLRPKPPGPRRVAWLATARPEQLAPPEFWWFVWFILAGRGWGKTRTGSEHVAQFARENPGAEIGVIGRTDAEARRLLLNGPSGLLSVLEPDEIARKRESTGDTQVVLTNGTTIYFAGAESPDALRGLNLWMVWCDELAAWRYQQYIWDEVLEPAVRIGPHPHIIVTTTPKPTKLVRTLLKDDQTHVTRGSTFDNVKNLAASFIARMKRKIGTRAGRQELYAEILDDVPGALLTRAALDNSRVPMLPRGAVQTWHDDNPAKGLRQRIVALDPSDGTADGDEAAIAVIGLGWDHELYVMDTQGHRDGVTAYLRTAVKLAVELEATIVVEKNHGGAYLIETLNQIMRDEDVIVPVIVVRASDGKRTRAEPVAALFEQNRLHMVGEQVDVEDQLTSWTGAPGEKSPDRLDALVWGATHFLRHTLEPESEGDDGVYAYEGGDNPDDWHDDGQDYSYGYG